MRQAGSVIEAGPADLMVTHECPAGLEHTFPPPPPWWSQADLGAGPIEVTGLDCDGADQGNWAILDVTSMRWLRFAGRPISNALRGLVSRSNGST